jgi:hypothetical protein
LNVLFSTSQVGRDRDRRLRPFKASIEALDGRALMSTMGVIGLPGGGPAHHAAFAPGRNAGAPVTLDSSAAVDHGRPAAQVSVPSSTAFFGDKATGFYLDSNTRKFLNNDSYNAYTNPFNGGAYQKWVMIPAGNNYFFLRDDATGFYLDSNAGQSVYTGHFNGGSFQQWQLIGKGGGYFFLRDKATGFYLDSSNNNVYTGSFNGGPYQQWAVQLTTP